MGNLKHGRSASPEYWAWRAMHQRCTNQKLWGYRHYGGRGIKVAPEFRHFQGFYDYLGPRPTPKHSLDRINNNGDYAPGNVRWATKAEQMLNRSDNRLLTVDGRTQTLTEWSQETGLKVATLWARFHIFKWSPEQVVRTPKMSAHEIAMRGVHNRWGYGA